MPRQKSAVVVYLTVARALQFCNKDRSNNNTKPPTARCSSGLPKEVFARSRSRFPTSLARSAKAAGVTSGKRSFFGNYGVWHVARRPKQERIGPTQKQGAEHVVFVALASGTR